MLSFNRNPLAETTENRFRSMSEQQYKKPLLDLPQKNNNNNYYNGGRKTNYPKKSHKPNNNNNDRNSQYKINEKFQTHHTEKENHSPDSGYDFNENPLFEFDRFERKERYRDRSGSSNRSRRSSRNGRSRKNSFNKGRRHTFAEPTVPQPYNQQLPPQSVRIKIKEPEIAEPIANNTETNQLEALTEGLEKMDLSCQTPLNDPWTLYIDHITTDTQQSVEDYTSNLSKIYKITTIETFWQVFNNIPVPRQLPTNYSFHLMRGDRRPVWEDPQNQNAGYWKLKCQKSKGNMVWHELVLAAIGEQFSEWGSNKPVEVSGQDGIIKYETDQIVGISVSIRERDDHFMVWNSNYKCTEKSTVVEDIKNNLLPKTKFHSIFYKDINEHEDFDCNKYNGKIFFRPSYNKANKNNQQRSQSFRKPSNTYHGGYSK